MATLFKFHKKSEQKKIPAAENSAESVPEIKVHEYTKFPTKAWDSMKQRIKTLRPSDPSRPIPKDHVRFVCISDTHTKIEDRHGLIPPGDILLHAGDITIYGSLLEIDTFNKFLGELPHRHKVVIAGNHDLSLDEELSARRRKELEQKYSFNGENREEYLEERGLRDPKQLFTNCTYLQDSSVNICGINVYGSPWQPEYCRWAFNLPRGEKCLEKWNMIPETTDILITHGPPVGHGDRTWQGKHCGCVELLTSVQNRIKPHYHVFGHIHEGYGVTTDGQTVFINASTCTLKYSPNNRPIVFDYPIPEGYMKDEYAVDRVISPSAPVTMETVTETEEDLLCELFEKKLR